MLNLFFYCPSFKAHPGVRNYVSTPNGWVEYNNWVTREDIFEPLPEWMDNFVGWNLVYHTENEVNPNNIKIISE